MTSSFHDWTDLANESQVKAHSVINAFGISHLTPFVSKHPECSEICRKASLYLKEIDQEVDPYWDQHILEFSPSSLYSYSRSFGKSKIGLNLAGLNDRNEIYGIIVELSARPSTKTYCPKSDLIALNQNIPIPIPLFDSSPINNEGTNVVHSFLGIGKFEPNLKDLCDLFLDFSFGVWDIEKIREYVNDYSP